MTQQEENIVHKRNAALKQVRDSFGIDPSKDGANTRNILTGIFGEPWNDKIAEHSVENIKGAIIAAHAALGDRPPVSAPPKSRPPATGSARQQGESYQDYIRRKYTVIMRRRDRDGNFVDTEYLQTAGRILLWWADHPLDSGWQLITEPVASDAESVVFKASIINPAGVVIATGFGWASSAGDKAKNFGGRIWEKAETAAIGRALAHAGYGTEDPDDDHPADAPVGQE